MVKENNETLHNSKISKLSQISKAKTN